jgi:hypothetical protein
MLLPERTILLFRCSGPLLRPHVVENAFKHELESARSSQSALLYGYAQNHAGVMIGIPKGGSLRRVVNVNVRVGALGSAFL